MGLLSAGLALAGCSMPDFDSIRAPDAATLFRPYSVTSFRDKPVAPVTANDLVDAGGGCPAAGPPAGPAGADGPLPDGTPAMTAGVTLEMTECEVVQRVGAPQQVNIGAGSAGERVAVLTYLGGPRPGIYHFAGGRLKAMERAPEPQQPARPAKRGPKAKKQTAAR